MKFDQIVCVDQTGLTSDRLRQLQHFSHAEVKCYSDYPALDEEIIARVHNVEGSG